MNNHALTPLRKTTIVGKRAYTLVIWNPENADTYDQAINPRNGKAWQAHRNSRHFEGKLANMKALRAFEMALRQREPAKEIP